MYFLKQLAKITALGLLAVSFTTQAATITNNWNLDTLNSEPGGLKTNGGVAYGTGKDSKDRWRKVFGNAWHFTGGSVNDHGYVSNFRNGEYNYSFTFMLWVKPESTNDTILNYAVDNHESNEIKLHINSSKYLEVYIMGTKYTFTAHKFLPYAWHHVVVRWHNNVSGTGKLELWVDNVLRKAFTGVKTNKTLQLGGKLVIGANQTSSGSLSTPFKGHMDEIRHYKTYHVTTTDIKTSYNKGQSMYVALDDQMNNSSVSSLWTKTNNWNQAMFNTKFVPANVLTNGAHYLLKLSPHWGNEPDYESHGAELKSVKRMRYGTYETKVTTPNPRPGLMGLSLFSYIGGGTSETNWDKQDEIDIEILTRTDPFVPGNGGVCKKDGKMEFQLNYMSRNSFSYNPTETNPQDNAVKISLGVNPYVSPQRTFKYVWRPTSIKWYMDGTKLFEYIQTASTGKVKGYARNGYKAWYYDAATDTGCKAWPNGRVAYGRIPTKSQQLLMNIWAGKTSVNDWLGVFDRADGISYAKYNWVEYTPWIP